MSGRLAPVERLRIVAVCPACSRPAPPPLLALPAAVLEQLDASGPCSARRLADRLHRRDAAVRAALHELAAAGVVRLEQPTRSPRSQRWAIVSEERGRAWDARETPSTRVEGLSLPLAALVGSDGLGRLLGLAALGLLAAAVVVAVRRTKT